MTQLMTTGLFYSHGLLIIIFKSSDMQDACPLIPAVVSNTPDTYVLNFNSLLCYANKHTHFWNKGPWIKLLRTSVTMYQSARRHIWEAWHLLPNIHSLRSSERTDLLVYCVEHFTTNFVLFWKLLLLLLLLLSSSSLSSPLCKVIIPIFLRQTVSLGNKVLQLFCCYYSWCLYR